MEKKILFGTLGGGLTGMLVSMAIFMGLFGSMSEQWMTENAACLKPMEGGMVWWIVMSVLWGLLYSLLFHKIGVSTFKGGAIAGAWIGLLIALIMGISQAMTYVAYPFSWLPYDVISSTVVGTLAGGVVGWIFSRVK